MRAKVSMSLNVHGKVYVFKFCGYFAVLISRFSRGSRKLRKFGPRENFLLYGTSFSLDLTLDVFVDLGRVVWEKRGKWGGQEFITVNIKFVVVLDSSSL